MDGDRDPHDERTENVGIYDRPWLVDHRQTVIIAVALFATALAALVVVLIWL